MFYFIHVHTRSEKKTETLTYRDGSRETRVLRDDAYRVTTYGGLLRWHEAFQFGRRIAAWPSVTLPGGVLLAFLALAVFVVAAR